MAAICTDPLWSAKVLLEAPALIQQVHTDYFAAGADCAITATYQATFAGFARRGLDEQASAQIMRRAVELALAARDAFWAVPANRAGRPHPLVAASIGPYGAGLADGSEYRGDYGLDEAALMDFHRPRMAVLAGGRVQLEGAPLELIASTRGRVWKKTIDREELPKYADEYVIISSRLFAGQTIIHIMADSQPAGFDPVEAGLEDVYFTTLANSRMAETAQAA